MANRVTDSVINEQLKPICAVCNKEVDRMTNHNDWMRDEVVLVVECHGQTDICSLNRSDFQEMLYACKIGKGRAFDKQMLGNTKQIEHKDAPVDTGE